MRHDQNPRAWWNAWPRAARALVFTALAGCASPALAGPGPLDYTTATVAIDVTSPENEQLHFLRRRVGDDNGGFQTLLLIMGNLDLFGTAELRLDPDPLGHWTIRATNPLEVPIGLRFSLAMPTIRMRADQWRADAKLDATLTDENGDGASLEPGVVTVFGDPFAPPVKQIMDTGVSLLIGNLSYFGGAPSAPLGKEGLVAAAGGSATRSWSSAAGALPDHSWIGPDVAWNTMSLQVAFTLSPGDSIDITARFDITPVPEPRTSALLALGLLAVGLTAGRRAAKRMASARAIAATSVSMAREAAAP